MSRDRFPITIKLIPICLFLVSWIILSGCADHTYTTQEHRSFTLTVNELQKYGVAFITPSSITGREQDRQSLALTFAEVLREKRSDIHVVTLPETLGAVNRADMLDDYKAMYDDYADTGIFKHTTLKQISKATGARYLAQLKLAGFNQGSSTRFGVFGLRLLETKRATLRIFLQIWDSQEGIIAWEGYEEMFFANDTYSEQGVMFYDVTRAIAEHMVANIPDHENVDELEQSVKSSDLRN